MRRSFKYGLYGAVLAGLIGAPVVWAGLDKTVDLVVDGHAHTVSTTASDVAQVLDAHGYPLTSHDIVAPSATTPLRDGMRVVLDRGRLLHLSINGSQRNVWTTEPTVADAMHQLGYNAADFVSVSRSRRLPLTPSDMTIRTPRAVTVIADGSEQHVDTTASTVGGLLGQLGITVDPKDTLSVPETAAVVPGQVVRITRHGEKIKTVTRSVPFTVRHQVDATIPSGQREVLRAGRAGSEKVTYSLVKEHGKTVARTVLSTVTVRAPQQKIIGVGTAPVTLHRSSPIIDATPGSNRAIAQQLLAKRGWSDQFGCLDQMWDRESGWRTDAYNPSGAYGIPQALPGAKMAAAGANWRTSATTQITWGLDYIAERYGTPCDAWSYWQAHGNY